MREPSTRQIGENVYSVTPLPAGKALRLLTRLGRVAGPGLARLATADGTAAEGVVEAVAGMLRDLPDDELETVCRDLAASSQVTVPNGRPVALGPTWEMHFAGALDELFDWARFALEVQFGPFAMALQRAVRAAGSTAPAPSRS